MEGGRELTFLGWLWEKQALVLGNATPLKAEVGTGHVPTSLDCVFLHSRGAAVRAPLSI